MKAKFTLLLFIALFYSISIITNAQPKLNTTSSSVDTTQMNKYHLDLGIYATMSNTYNRGNLDDWWADITNDPGRQVDQGSPAFFAFDVALLFPSRKSSNQIGFGLGFTIPAEHSLWGSQTFYGGRQEIVLSPQILSFNFLLKSQMKNIPKLYLTVIPSFLMGWVTGKCTSFTPVLNFTWAPAPGAGISVGAEYFFSKSLATSFKFGYRYLKANPMYKDSSSSTGYSQITVNGEDVKADLSGSYMIIGIILRLPL